MTNRAQRRAEVARFRREVSRAGLVSYLTDADDPRLAGEPLLRDAVRYWRRNVPVRAPRCFGCQAVFSDDLQAGAFLLVVPSRAPTSASVSGLCRICWTDLSDDEIKAAADRAVRPVTPNGL